MRRMLRLGLPIYASALVVVAGVILATPAALPAAMTRVRADGAACTAAPPPWMDTTKTADQRADALIPCMTLDERIALLHGVGDTQGHTGYVPANTRLGIPALALTDGPAGVRPNQGQTTALPAPAALAATWDPSLAQEYGTVLGREASDLGNNVIFAPMVNIARVPQGGRDFETLGEDPYLTSQLGVADISGIQAQHVIADVKHYAANNQEDNRGTVSADVDQRTLHEIYLPAFEAAVTQAHVGTVMAAYNRVNGVYSSENRDLLTTILKEQWGFQGWVLSDYGATHSTVPAANNGLDMELPSGQFFADALKAAVQNGQVSTATIDEHVHRILRTMFAFGLFDRPASGGTIDAQADGRIARDIAEQGTVLLKNSGALLPLDSGKLGSLAVIGPDAGQAMTGGGGSSHVNPFYTVSPLTGVTNRAGAGVKITYNDGSDPQAAANAARSSNVAVVFVGDNESEGGDRADLALPNNGDQLIQAVAAANPRTIVVLNAGAPVLMPWADGVQGIVQAWYPGEEDGNAIAAVLFGDVNPSGKLPVTFPRSAQDVAANTPQQYPGVDGVAHYSEGVFVGYRYADQNSIAPLFPFGYGLSYTTFGYSNLSVTTGGQSAPYAATVGLDVTNTGQRAGAEVAQLYLGIPATNVPEPPRQLKGFQKVLLQPGQTQHVTFTLNARDLSYWDARADDWVVQHGTYQVMVGGSSRDLPLHGSFAVSQANGPRYVTVQAPGIDQPGTTTAVTTTFTNGGDSGLQNVGLSLHTPSGWTAVATSPTAVATLGAGQSVQVTWQVTIPASAGAGSFTLAGQAAYTGGQGAGSSQNNVTVAIPFASFDKAYNNVGISDNSNPAAGNYDGSGYSYSAQALAAVGLAPGALVTHDGVAFTWPNAAAGTADNVVANGQVIGLSGSGQTLGFLGASSFGTQSGAGLVTYTDGSAQPFTIALADWYANSPAAGGDTLATASNWNEPPGGIGSHPVSVYYAPVSLQAGKTVQAITLPTNGNMHIFAIATSGGASGGPPTPTAPATAPTSTPIGSSCGTTNVALNQPATASSLESAGTPASAAVDGNTGTRWSSAFSDPQWLQVDLGSTRSVCKVVLQWEAAYGKQYQIQVSNNASTWTTIYNQTNGAGGTETLNVSGSGRYIRMYGAARSTGYGYSLWEFQVYSTGSSGAPPTATPAAPPTSTPTASGSGSSCGTTNLALNQPATASSLENAGTPASAAVDGNTGTRWSSGFSDPQWLQVDLGSARGVCKVVLNWEAAYGKQYQIQVSNDAQTWTSIYNQTNGAGGVETLNVSGSGRYVRMYGTQRGTGYGYSLWEFQVYGE